MKRARPTPLRPSEPVAIERRGSIADAAVVLGVAVLGIWATYHPADSIAVERGGALGWSIAVLVWASIAWWLFPRGGEGWEATASLQGRWLDGCVVALAAWMMISAMMTSGSALSGVIGGNWRSASNEAWLWLAGAVWFVVVRRGGRSDSVRSSLVGIALVATTMMAVHAWHQSLVSLPESLRDYLRDPDGQLRALGIEAAPGSATRMIFENRLRDGGPTAAFALANSLAGPLALAVGSLAAAIFLASQSAKPVDAPEPAAFEKASVWLDRLVWLLLFVVIGGALLLTGSRTGVAAAGLTMLAVVAYGAGKRWRSVRVGARWAGLLVIGAAVIAGLGWSLGRGSEWVETAPTSIAYRWQYWRAAFAMVSDHPWWGVGPGNFQSVYPAYRDVAAHETIAEPHNFLMETIAAGGWVAGLLLVVAMFAACIVSGFLGAMVSTPAARKMGPKTDEGPSTQTKTPDLVVFLIGLVVGGVMVWGRALRSGELPDVDANLLAIPAAGCVAAWWFFLCRRTDRSRTDWAQPMATAGALAGWLHLSFSGGMTVPGVAWLIWTLSAIATTSDASPQMGDRSRAAAAIGLLGMIVAAVAYGWFYLPMTTSQAWFDRAAIAVQRGQTAAARRALGAALRADPAAREPAIWSLQLEHQAWIAAMSQGSADSTRDDRWRAAVAEVEKRAGRESQALAIVGQSFLHRYQVAGQRDDLVAAWRFIASSLQLNPANEQTMAQAAEIRRELGTSQRVGWPDGGPAITVGKLPSADAVRLAQTAVRLSIAGGVLTRRLDLHRIQVARPLGTAAVPKPVERPADQVLAELLGKPTLPL